MAAEFFPSIILASSENGLLYAFEHSTLSGKTIMVLLFVGSVFSWTVMVTKLRTINIAKKQRDRFLARFRADRSPLRLFADRERFDGAPIFSVYRSGCREMTFQLLGSAEVDETFRGRLEIADKISPAQMRVVGSAMERAVGEAALRLESQMILLATAVSGAPFLGLLGTVWGVMDTFGGVAMAGSANLAAMAPGVSAALITTVTGLLVAIPAMFGYNYLVTTVRGMIVELDNFAAELASEFEHKYVDHGERSKILDAAMRRFSDRGNLQTLSELNVTPLLDLAFVLLIIFMITTPLMENKTDLVLPTGDASKNAVDPASVLTISIDRNETIQLAGAEMTIEEVVAELTARKAEKPELTVVVRSHKELPVQRLIDVLDAVKRAQISKVGVVTNPEK